MNLAEKRGKVAETDHLMSLPIPIFTEVLGEESLHVADEIFVVKAIDQYLRFRDTIRPLLEEEDPANDTTHLTEEEKKHREEVKAQHAEERKKAEEEALAKEAEAVAAMDALGKIQHESDKHQESI